MRCKYAIFQNYCSPDLDVLIASWMHSVIGTSRPLKRPCFRLKSNNYICLLIQAKHKYYTFIIVFLWSHLVVYYVDLYKQQIQKHVKHSEDFSCQISEDFFDISKGFFPQLQPTSTTHMKASGLNAVGICYFWPFRNCRASILIQIVISWNAYGSGLYFSNQKFWTLFVTFSVQGWAWR